MKNKEVLEKMFKIYGEPSIDWMGFKVTDNNPITFHHIVEERNGGKTNIRNGALLTNYAHQELHKLEISDKELYEEYRYWFKIINEMNCPPTKKVMKNMRYLKLRFITAIQVNEIIKEEMNFYEECLRKQITSFSSKKHFLRRNCNLGKNLVKK